MTQDHVNMMQVHFVEIKLVIILQLKQTLQIIVKHRMELTAIIALKVGFITLKILFLFQLLFNHILRLTIATQSMESPVNNLQDQIVILQMDICVQLIYI
jgi:hypothetical protein